MHRRACVLRNGHNVKLSKSFDVHHHSGRYMPPYSKTTDRRISLYSRHKCLHGTMAYTGYDGSACNSTAMGIIHSVIRTDFSAWVSSAHFDENRGLIINNTTCIFQVNTKGACQQCTSSVILSTYNCSSITVEEICSTTYSQLSS